MNKKYFVSQLHPATLLIYFMAIFLMATILNHPLYLLILFIFVIGLIVSLGALTKLKTYFLFSLMMLVFIVFMNTLVSKSGTTIIFRGPTLPVLGRILVSKEAMAFGFTMSLKLTVIVCAFCLIDHVLNSDRIFSLFTRLAPKSALTVILASIAVPRMKKNLHEIKTVMQYRGAHFGDQNLFQRIKSHYPLLKVLLLSSLEDSWQMGEALFARGFSSTKRSYYQRFSWQRKDTLIAAGTAISILGFYLSLIRNKGTFSFYPTMDELFLKQDLAYMVCICAGLMIMPLLDFGWKKWKFFRLKI